MIKAIIIDDEQKGREILEKLVELYCAADVEIVATAANVIEAFELIHFHQPALIFLDIEMPGGNGFSLLDKFSNAGFKVIITTAFDEYAIKAIKHHAFDYLLKPIDMDELVQAVASVKAAINSEAAYKKEQLAPQRLSLNSRLALPVKDGIFYLPVADILRVESDGGYSTFYASDGHKYMVSKNLKEYEDLLPEKEFFRVHKSHLINLKKVKKYFRTDGNFIEMENGAIVEIARRKKDEFLQVMNAGH